MKIEGQIPKVPVQDKNIQKGKEKEITQDQKSSAVKKAESDQFTVKRMRARIEAESDMDLEKVKALRESIKKGEYKVDNETLADKLLKDSLIEDLS